MNSFLNMDGLLKTSTVGASSDTPQPTPAAGASSDTLLQPTIASSSKPKRHRISGAEQKRRRKARLAELAKTNSDKTPGSASSAQKGKANPAGSGHSSKPVKKAGYPGSAKRNRSEGSEPSPNLRKKACPTPRPKPATSSKTSGSYAEASKRHLRVAVICRSNPLGKTTPQQAEILQEKLYEQLDTCIFALKDGEKPPIFNGWQHSGEILRITCNDNHSLEWLKATVSNLPQPWSNAQLEVVEVDRLPRLVKAALWIPGKADERETVIQRLAAHNRHLKVSNWCVFHDAPKEEPLGRLLVFGINDEDAKTLGETGRKLNYRFSQLSVKLKAGDSASPQPSSQETATPSLQEVTPMELVPNEGNELQELESLLLTENSPKEPTQKS